MTLIIIIMLILIIVYLYYQNRQLQASNQSSGNASNPVIFDSENEELIAERDLAIRQKNEAQQEALALNNRLKNKHQEITRKEQEIERLKQESSHKEIALNKKISEKNGLITTLQREINQAKDKYSKQGKLLDEEQLEAKKLEESLEKLQEEKQQLKHEHTEQLRAINLLFDSNTKDYQSIDFEGLYALLTKITHKGLPGSFPKEKKDD